MARRRHSNRRRNRGSFRFLYKLLSILVICGAIIAALTLFFRVDTIVVTGQQRYTEDQVREAAWILPGDNLFLLDKYDVAGGIVEQLPYIEEIRINRKLPDTLLIQIMEYGKPMVIVQEGQAWFFGASENSEASGKIVDCQPEEAAAGYGVVSGCELLAPSVGSKIAFATEYSTQQESLLALLTALVEGDMLEQVDGIRLDDSDALCMDYAGRFTVKLPYGADYPYKMRYLTAILDDERVQDNMTGTIDMRRDDGRANFIQNVR